MCCGQVALPAAGRMSISPLNRGIWWYHSILWALGVLQPWKVTVEPRPEQSMDLSGVRGVADGDREDSSSQVEGNTGEKAGPLIHSLNFTVESHPTSCDRSRPFPFSKA